MTQRYLLEEEIERLSDECRARQAVEDKLRKALEAACDFIAETQRHGCPAGVVAIPSRIADALNYRWNR